MLSGYQIGIIFILLISWYHIMKTTRKYSIAIMMAMVFGLMLSPAISQNADARVDRPDVAIHGELTSPSDGAPFGGDSVIGKYYIAVRGDITSITTSVYLSSSADMVFEGWLVDKDSGEKTSIGILKETGQGMLAYGHTNVQNNFDNDLIVITEEPVHDADPAPNTPIGGAVLGSAFGQ